MYVMRVIARGREPDLSVSLSCVTLCNAMDAQPCLRLAAIGGRFRLSGAVATLKAWLPEHVRVRVRSHTCCMFGVRVFKLRHVSV